jgi:hypothetical protein
MQRTLTANEQALLANSLRIAAEQFNSDAHTMTNAGQLILAIQFLRQNIEARTLADWIENCAYIQIED